jgi:hypothetical protein
MLQSAAWKVTRSEGGIVARRSSMTASRAMATLLTISTPGGVTWGAPVTSAASLATPDGRPFLGERGCAFDGVG